MGLFGPSQQEKMRRTASEAFPNAAWQMDVDWSSGSKLHKLHGSLTDHQPDTDNMQLARDVWKVLTKKYRLHPDDAFDGLLDVSVQSPGGAVQSTGIGG
jgi:hypothetical protein